MQTQDLTQDALKTAGAEAEAEAKAEATRAKAEAEAKAAAAAARHTLDLLPWDDSKHAREDLEQRLPLGAKVQRAAQCTGHKGWLLLPGAVGIVKGHANLHSLEFSHYTTFVEVGPFEDSGHYHLSTLELITKVGD